MSGAGGRTPSQTIGPFFGVGLPWPGSHEVVPPGTPGAFRIGGRVLDGRGEAVPDALIETWQIGPRALPSPSSGFGRCPTDAEGRFAIVTCKPDAVRGADGRMQAPHVAVSVFARGLLRRAVTRIYFSDEDRANRIDPVLSAIGDAPARATLIAIRAVAGGYTFDIRLQGKGETVFFDI
jgi:protocatechuate 3,4-dioxygenase, alpha subunit